MSVSPDFKTIKEKKLDADTTMIIKKNIMSGRIFVEFASVNPKLFLQKNFPDTFEGKKASEQFSRTIKNGNQLKEYFSK